MDTHQPVANQRHASVESLPLIEFGPFPTGVNYRATTKQPLVIHHADSRKLCETEVMRLSGELLQVYEGGFLLPQATGPSQVVQRLDDLAAHIRGAQRVLIARAGGEPVAFLCSQLLELSVGKTYHLLFLSESARSSYN